MLTGATASGKTTLAIQLAKIIDAEIICADSRIIYKNLDIVSAKPTKEEQEGIKHHLIDIIEANEEFSAGDFVERSKKIIENTGKNIIITGGTWFYIKSLLDEENLPKCKINQELRDKLNKLESNLLYEKLTHLDSKRAKAIHPNNKDKIIRSIEMCLELNMPISEYKREKNKNYDALWFMTDFSKEELYKRINKRVDIMIKTGLYDEWIQNDKRYGKTKIMLNTIGYKEFYDFKDEIYKTKEEAIEKIKQHTRNFAKRQMTYFKSNEKIKKINTLEDILKEIK